MNSNSTSRSTNIDSDSNREELIGLPKFNGKYWNKGWDSIAKQARLEKDLFEMVEADIAASSQGAPVVTKKPAPAKHATLVIATITASSTAAAQKAEEDIITNLGPSFEKTLEPSSYGGDMSSCLGTDAKKSAPV